MFHWKLQKPEFFVAEKEIEGKSDDFEYLSNPEMLKLNKDQILFLDKFYPEFAEKDPWAVLEWLHKKAVAY
jgi:uncharacterized protein with von Willebrand factor type A (vWA) domain